MDGLVVAVSVLCLPDAPAYSLVVTGPANGPRPASSMPQTGMAPQDRSKVRLGMRRI